MCEGSGSFFVGAGSLVQALLVFAASPAAGYLNLGPEELVQAGGVDIDMGDWSWSVPSFVPWDDDGLKDLIVGERIDDNNAKVRVYLNDGTASAPHFSGFTYAEHTAGGDVTCIPVGCLGCFPRVVYWDGDARKDLLVGLSEPANIKVFLNTGTEANPTFDAGALIEVGEPGSKVPIDVGKRAAPCVVDWNSDGRKDLVIGEFESGYINVFLNEGTDAAPDFRTGTLLQDETTGTDLMVPTARSSPDVLDLDGDGRKDLLTGNSLGNLLLYSNTGTDAAPTFASPPVEVEADGVVINIGGSLSWRSRPFICDWTGDGLIDVLVGAFDGMVRLYQGTTIIAWRSVRDHDGVGELAIDLDPSAIGEAVVSETRRYGIQKIEVDITTDTLPAVIGTIEAEDTTTHVTYAADDPPTVIDHGDGTYTLVLEWTGGLPDEACYYITLAGKLSCNIVGDNDCMVRGLTGDTNGNGDTNLVDMAQTKGMNGADPTAAGNARFDVNTGGTIDLVDMALVKSLNGNSASCP